MASFTFLYAFALALMVASGSTYHDKDTMMMSSPEPDTMMMSSPEPDTMMMSSPEPNTMMMSSPEPELDPLGGPALAVVSTGSSEKPMKILKRVNIICPKDYPTGFSILCHPGGPARKARFFVNRKFVKVEYKEPYYIAGDWRGVVRPWTDYPKKKAKIRCKLSRRTKIYAKILFVCD